jgi:mannose-6-phosphate isomerase-like protein (cupin superfamily)
MIEQAAPPAPYQVAKIRPEIVSKGKSHQKLFRTDVLSAGVQVVSEGGETNLHAHSATDAVWLVLDGQATFYGEGDEVLAKLDRFEALLIPHGAPYWFESSSDEPLVILRFGAQVPGIGIERVNYTERRQLPSEVVAGAFFNG